MKTRIITGLFIGLFLIAICWFSGTLVLPIVVSVLMIVGTGEVLHCTGLLGKLAVSIPSFLFSAAVSTLLFFENCKEFDRFVVYFTAASAVYVLALFTVSTFSKGKISVDDIFAAFTTSFYIAFAFACWVLIRARDGGMYLLMVTIWLPLISDIFAYFTGYFFGKHKLIPDVSPKKTIEGSVGGMVFCGVGCIVFSIVICSINGQAIDAFLFIRMFAVGLICSVISQIGDLIMSVVKRRYDVKDYGRLFPGHGGVLDRFDSVMAVAPIVMLLTFFFPSLVSFGA